MSLVQENIVRVIEEKGLVKKALQKEPELQPRHFLTSSQEERRSKRT